MKPGGDKVLLVKLSCGHSLTFARSAAPLTGNAVDCSKCPALAPPRLVESRQWVAGKARAP